MNESEYKHDALSALRDVFYAFVSARLPDFDSVPVCEFPETETETLLITKGNVMVRVDFSHMSEEELDTLVKRHVESSFPSPVMN